MTTRQSALAHHDVSLVEVIDRVVGKGVVLTGDITLSVADVDLIYLGLRLLIASADTVQGRGAPRDERP